MAQEQSHTSSQAHEEHATMSKGTIWKVFFYLLGITIVEFFIALYMRPHGLSEGIANLSYIVLTLVKAFYIVAYFMHLKFERYALITSIVISFVLIIYFIVLLLTEGSYLHIHMNSVR